MTKCVSIAVALKLHKRDNINLIKLELSKMFARATAVLLVTIAVATACRFAPNAYQGLDFNRYQGRWYLIEAGPVAQNETGPINCVYEQYNPSTLNSLVYTLMWHGETSNGTIIEDPGFVTLPEPATQSIINMFIDNTVFHSVVVATDYATWALEYSCEDRLGWERFMIRSRTTTLNDTVKETLHHILAGFGVDPRQLNTVIHTNCTMSV